MFFLDITWGETFVLTGLAMALIGRKDLPKASRFLGTQVGKVVGFLQGVRVRADRYADQHELKALHNELRSGLRELDTVRAELAIAASSRGLVGRTLSNHQPQQQQQLAVASSSPWVPNQLQDSPAGEEDAIMNSLAPRQQSVAAVAEMEWEKQGIGFRSRAEMGMFSKNPSPRDPLHPQGKEREKSGSMLLAGIIQDSLIFDQYDRTVREQDQLVQRNVDQIWKQRQGEKAAK